VLKQGYSKVEQEDVSRRCGQWKKFLAHPRSVLTSLQNSNNSLALQLRTTLKEVIHNVKYL